MKKHLKTSLLLILGLLLGLVIHGIIEIPALWILMNKLPCLFYIPSWDTWIKIHLVFTIATEILGIVLVLWINKKYGKIK